MYDTIKTVEHSRLPLDVEHGNHTWSTVTLNMMSTTPVFPTMCDSRALRVTYDGIYYSFQMS